MLSGTGTLFLSYLALFQVPHEMLSAGLDCFKDLRNELPIPPRSRWPVSHRRAGLGHKLVGDEATRPIPSTTVGFSDPELDRAGWIVRDSRAQQQSDDSGASRHPGGPECCTAAHDRVLGPGCGRCALPTREEGRCARLPTP